MGVELGVEGRGLRLLGMEGERTVAFCYREGWTLPISVAHFVGEFAWLIILVTYGWDFFATMSVSSSLDTTGQCPSPEGCGSSASLMVALSAIQPLIVLCGMAGIYVYLVACFKGNEDGTGASLHAGARLLYWLGCFSGIVLVIAQLWSISAGVSTQVLLGPTLAPDNGLRRLAEASGAVPPPSSMCTGNANHQENVICDLGTVLREDADVTVGSTQLDCCDDHRVTGMCAGNHDKTQEPDVSCQSPLSAKNNWRSIQGRSPEKCCECITGDLDVPRGFCVATADTRNIETAILADNACTRMMKYSACGSDDDISLCATANPPPDECAQCAETGPSYGTFEYLADQFPTRMQSLCMTANRYGCTYIFRRATEVEQCVEGMCSVNSIAHDFECSEPMVLKAKSSSIAGASDEICCHKTGLCVGNSNTTLEPDFACVAPGTPRENSDSIIGRSQEKCCTVTGMCSGNDDKDREPDVSCTSPSLLRSDSATIESRDPAVCCHTTGMCKGNTDVDSEPGIECAAPSQLVAHAAIVSGRDNSSCCHVTGMCTGNTDRSAEPNIDCVFPKVPVVDASGKDKSSWTVGRHTSDCCYVTEMCAGNTDSEGEPPVACAAPQSPLHNAHMVVGRIPEKCCTIQGMCSGNVDNVHEPDIQCPGQRTPKDEWAMISARDPETCCQCVDNPEDLVDAYCVTTADEHVDGDHTVSTYQAGQNECTDIMVYASCEGEAVACREDPTYHGANSDICAACAEEAPYPSFQSKADANTAQTMCIGGDNKYDCTYIFRRSLAGQRCVTGMCAGNSDPTIDPDITCTFPSVPVGRATKKAGRTEDECCIRSGMCANNTNAQHEPAIECPPPFVPRPHAEDVQGRGVSRCCITTGKCTGNIDRTLEPDIVCDAPSVLADYSSEKDGRDKATCCQKQGMCAGNVSDSFSALCAPVGHQVKCSTAFLFSGLIYLILR